MRHHLLILAAPLVLLSACASAPSETADVVVRDAAEFDGASSYGLFLAGEAALSDGKTGEASVYFDRARLEGGDPDLLSERSMTAALLAGDITRAAAMAPSGETASEAFRRLGALVQAVELMALNKGERAREILTSGAIGFPHRSAAAMLAPWAAAQAGDLDAAVARPEVGDDRMAAYLGQFGQALLYERARRYDEAETNFKALGGGPSPSDIVVLDYGAFLERRGRRADAIALYDEALSRAPENLGVKAARARAAAKKAPPPMPPLREGAAQAMLGQAVAMIAAKQSQIGMAYLRLALRLDPERDEAWLMLGDLLSESGDLVAARHAYGKVHPDAVTYPAARAKLIWTYQSGEDSETALKLAREAAASGDRDALVTLADLLRANKQHAEAVEVLSRVMSGATKADWRLLFARAVSYEQLDRWPEAETDLQAALKLQPDEPELLNYLGYLWIDRGDHLQEALGMVQRAVASEPKSGAMVDSLGWAYYRLKDYPKAVETLEAAIELEAGDPDINNHLGDAYWRVGRQDEARFQWRRVLSLNPDEKMKAEAEAKIARGLGPDGPAVAPKLAGQ